jgi:poly(3-hydroxyalkanoate) synthetase
MQLFITVEGRIFKLSSQRCPVLILGTYEDDITLTFAMAYEIAEVKMGRLC